MKYTNHLNVIVAIIGVIVIAQTLTRTFWNSAPERQFSVEVPAARPRIQVQAPRPAAGQKRSAAQAIGVLPGTVGAPNSAVPSAGAPSFAGRSRLLTAPPVQSNPNPGVVGTPSGATTAAPNVVTIPSGSTTAPPLTGGVDGEMGGRAVRGQSQSPFGRPTFRSPGAADSRSLNLPPPGGNEAGKRRPDPNAPAPPVRSSMPEQRIQ